MTQVRKPVGTQIDRTRTNRSQLGAAMFLSKPQGVADPSEFKIFGDWQSGC